MLHPEYPTASEVDRFCSELVERAEQIKPTVQLLDPWRGTTAVRNAPDARYVRIERPGCEPYYAIWQPVLSGGPAPLLVHVPGYGAEMSVHPHLVAAGFNILHVSPQAYCTPDGFNESKRSEQKTWPVLPDTITSCGERGYRDWLTDVLVAVAWGQQQPHVQPQRLAFFGTSQGGGTALLLASLMRDRGVKAVCADEPYLTGFFMMLGNTVPGAYALPLNALASVARESPQRLRQAWRALGYYDTLSHAHRLTMPTLLTAGGKDISCPLHTIRALFDRLPAQTTRNLTVFADAPHGYMPGFGELVRAWCTLYL